MILLIASGKADYSLVQNGLGQNGYGPGYPGAYSALSAFVFEIVMTFIFVTIILGATQSDAPADFAGLAIGLTLTAIRVTGINITSASVNPARFFGPAVFVGARLWVIYGCFSPPRWLVVPWPVLPTNCG